MFCYIIADKPLIFSVQLTNFYNSKIGIVARLFFKGFMSEANCYCEVWICDVLKTKK